MNRSLSQQAGPQLLSYLLNWGLYGVLSIQVCIYWIAFPTDNLAVQTLVYSIYILETAQTVSLTHDAFQTFVYGFMDPFSMDTMHNLWLDTYLFDGIVAFLVQIYFARRIYMLLSTTKLKLLSGIIVLLSITQFAGAIGTSVGVKKITKFSNFGQYSVIPGYLWIFGATLADILIAVTMVYALSQYDTTVRQTRNFVRRLKRLALETGSITAIVAPMVPLFYFCFPGQNYHVVPAVVVAKLYSNSLLVIFNSRIKIHDAGGSSGVASRRRMSISVTTNSNSRVYCTFPSSSD